MGAEVVTKTAPVANYCLILSATTMEPGSATVTRPWLPIKSTMAPPTTASVESLLAVLQVLASVEELTGNQNI